MTTETLDGPPSLARIFATTVVTDGTDWRWRLQLVDDDDTPIDLTGCTGMGTVDDDTGNRTLNNIVDLTVTIEPGSGGWVTITCDHTTTYGAAGDAAQNPRERAALWEVTLILPAGDGRVVSLWGPCSMTIRQRLLGA